MTPRNIRRLMFIPMLTLLLASISLSLLSQRRQAKSLESPSSASDSLLRLEPAFSTPNRSDNLANFATITVNTTADTVAADGFCSLREAIQAANTNAAVNECTSGQSGLDNIVFNIPGGGVKTINVTSPLPLITEAVNIDGYTQPGSSPNTQAIGNDAVLLIELNGTGVVGLGINSSGSTIRGLVFNRFASRGIHISGATANNNVIAGNFIGTDPAGTTDLGVTGRGIQIDSDASNNTIGGTTPAARNLISGNDEQGIFIFGATTLNNVIQGNYVGTNAAGTAAIGNSLGGIQAGRNTLVGGTTPGAGNLISGNLGGSSYGLGTDSGTTVQGNIIGLNATGTAAIPNTGGLALGGSNNIIGGTTAAARNVISGNSPSHGIAVFPGSGHQILGNYIGVNSAGTAAILNGGEAIILDGSNVQIGGTDPGAGNLIAGRVRLGTNGNTVQGNRIGTDGTIAFGGTDAGILVFG
ncbi:MAG TPA: CSLREA domain-containing protein, partial [Blastocatellia bacterium]|nr:CSLREA domain-containing protein [Blastocatellia bacterium]